TKSWFAFLRENVRNGFLLLALDLVVAIQHPETDFLSNRASHGGFAGAHKTHQVKVNVGRVHHVRRGKPANAPVAKPEIRQPWGANSSLVPAPPAASRMSHVRHFTGRSGAEVPGRDAKKAGRWDPPKGAGVALRTLLRAA